MKGTVYRASSDMKGTPIYGFKGYAGYPYMGLEQISRVPLYGVSGDIKGSAVYGFKRYEGYPYVALEEISRVARYGLQEI